MVNTIDAISGLFYALDLGDQKRGQILGPEAESQTENVKSSALGPKDCKTWNSRTYKDRSNDPSVSFQSPTHISPEMAATAVRAHEQEHVSHNAASAERQDMKAHSTVAIHSAICPECGRIYVSGGTTTTTYTSKQTLDGTGSEENKGNFVNSFV